MFAVTVQVLTVTALGILALSMFCAATYIKNKKEDDR